MENHHNKSRHPRQTHHHASRKMSGRELQRRKMTKFPIAASLLITLAATVCFTTPRAASASASAIAPQQATSSSAPGTSSASAATKKKSSKKHHASKREPTQKAPTPERISEIQSALAHNGYYQGNPNGKWDSNTISAMQKFQSDNGLSNSGKIDAPSLQKLGLGSGTAGVDAPKPITPKPATSAPASTSSATSSAQPAATTTSASSVTPNANSSPAPKPQR
jgi:peptidoglycan hydrolase-like protein with peptidoglycan-binding domain